MIRFQSGHTPQTSGWGWCQEETTSQILTTSYFCQRFVALKKELASTAGTDQFSSSASVQPVIQMLFLEVRQDVISCINYCFLTVNVNLR